MKLAIGSASRDGKHLAWFRKYAPSTFGLSELKRRLLDGRPCFEWEPYPQAMDDEETPFRQIEAILADAARAGVVLSFFVFYDSDDVSNLDAADVDEKRITDEVARNLIQSWRED